MLTSQSVDLSAGPIAGSDLNSSFSSCNKLIRNIRIFLEISNSRYLKVVFASSGRVSLVPLPLAELRLFVTSSLALRGVQAKAFASALPGQGKTFAIREEAAPEILHLLRVNALNQLDVLIDTAKTEVNYDFFNMY
jgi:type VI protein secretion system component VasA